MLEKKAFYDNLFWHKESNKFIIGDYKKLKIDVKGDAKHKSPLFVAFDNRDTKTFDKLMRNSTSEVDKMQLNMIFKAFKIQEFVHESFTGIFNALAIG